MYNSLVLNLDRDLRMSANQTNEILEAIQLKIKENVHYTGPTVNEFSTLTPSVCFRECDRHTDCGGASFLSDTTRNFNCQLFTALNSVKTEDEKNWISYKNKTFIFNLL
jgi:hypothetical protein